MIERMKYSRYRSHYSDCESVYGSYDKASKTIEVVIPDGRMKPSGVRGERFHTYQIDISDSTGKIWTSRFKAVCQENAMKQAQKWCKDNGGWTPLGFTHDY